MIYNFKFLIVANSVAVPDFYHALVRLVFRNLLQECFFFYFPSKGIIRQKKTRLLLHYKQHGQEYPALSCLNNKNEEKIWHIQYTNTYVSMNEKRSSF